MGHLCCAANPQWCRHRLARVAVLALLRMIKGIEVEKFHDVARGRDQRGRDASKAVSNFARAMKSVQ